MNIDKLIYWMEERQRIYLNRKAGKPWPWTKDPILQKHFFCNVYREQDRVTVWIRENWREPYADHKNLWFAMCVARQINLPETLEAIGFPDKWRPKHTIATMRERAAQGLKIYTSAYMLRSDKGDKPSYTVNQVLQPVWDSAEKNPWRKKGCTIQAATEYLESFSGWGGFLSYEVATDLVHTRYLKDAPDRDTWANPGPGAQRGLNRLNGRDLATKLPRDTLIKEMRTVLKEVRRKADSRIIPVVELRDIEHSLCELDKMSRAQESQESDTIGLRLYSRPKRTLF